MILSILFHSKKDTYFQKQLEAVGNYYTSISDSQLTYSATIITNQYYQVSNSMEYYARGDGLLARFYSEALDSAKSDIENYFEGGWSDYEKYVSDHRPVVLSLNFNP